MFQIQRTVGYIYSRYREPYKNYRQRTIRYGYSRYKERLDMDTVDTKNDQIQKNEAQREPNDTDKHIFDKSHIYANLQITIS